MEIARGFAGRWLGVHAHLKNRPRWYGEPAPVRGVEHGVFCDDLVVRARWRAAYRESDQYRGDHRSIGKNYPGQEPSGALGEYDVLDDSKHGFRLSAQYFHSSCRRLLSP